jgi:HEPN domain-containing protein
VTTEDLESAKTAFTLAQKDLEIAIQYIDDDEQHQNCGLHLQQAAEKLIKALIHLNGGNFTYRKGHIMGHLRRQLEAADGNLDEKFETLDALEIYAVDGRYMILSDLDRESLGEHLPLVEELLAVVKGELANKVKIRDE